MAGYLKMSKFTHWTLVEPGESFIYASLGLLSTWDFYSGNTNSELRQTAHVLEEERISLLGPKMLLGT